MITYYTAHRSFRSHPLEQFYVSFLIFSQQIDLPHSAAHYEQKTKQNWNFSICIFGGMQNIGEEEIEYPRSIHSF